MNLMAPPLCREELETMASVLDMLATNGYEAYASLKEAADYGLPRRQWLGGTQRLSH